MMRPPHRPVGAQVAWLVFASLAMAAGSLNPEDLADKLMAEMTDARIDQFNNRWIVRRVREMVAEEKEEIERL